MKKNILLFAVLFVLCLAAVFPKTVLAAETGETTDTTETDYSTFFDTAASTIQAGVDFYTMRELSMKMYEAMIFDPRAFVEELAFREAWLQQAIADGMAETLYDSYLDTAAGVLAMLIYNATSWDSQRYGLPVLYDDPSISEKKLLDFFICRFYVTQYSRPQEYRDDYYTLFQEGYTEVHTESHSFLLWQSLKETPLPFLRALLQQDEQTQAMVIKNILFYRYSPRGVVLINVLEETQTCENLTEAEKDLITSLIEGLADAKAYVTATGPDPQELAARKAQESPQPTQPDQTEPTIPIVVKDYAFNPSTILNMIETNLSVHSTDESFFDNLANAYLMNPTLFCETIAVLPANDILVLAKAVSYSLQKSDRVDKAAIPDNCSDPLVFAVAKLVYNEVVNVEPLSITEFVWFYDTVKRIDPEDIIDMESIENTEAVEEPTVPAVIEKQDPPKSSVPFLMCIPLALLIGFLLGRFLPTRRHNCE